MTYEAIRKCMLDRGMKFFHGYMNVNIVYVRMKRYRVNQFDDYGFLLYEDELGRPVTLQRPVTTRPGKTVLNSPINRRGAAILVPGQYLSSHKLDLHKGKYEAVCQRKGKVKVYRDNDMDNSFDYNPDSIEEGFFGINCHKATWETYYVNGWSAGCMVDQQSDWYNVFINLVKKSVGIYGNSLSLTLLKEEWL